MRSDCGDDQRPSSVLYSRGTGGQFAEEAEQGGCGFLIGEVFQRHGSREMRRGRVEADADEVLVAPVGERVDYGAQFYRPEVKHTDRGQVLYYMGVDTRTRQW